MGLTKKERKRLKAIELASSPMSVLRAKVAFFGVKDILKENWKFLVILLVLTLALFANGMSGNFVSDDYAALNQNDKVRTIGYVIDNIWTIQPTAIVTFVLALIFGNQVSLPFHLFSLFLHLNAIIGGFVFLYILSENRLASRIAIALFAVLAVHVEAVTWISGKPYLFIAVFYLWAFNFFLLYFKSDNKSYYTKLTLIFVLLSAWVEVVRFPGLLIVMFIYWLYFKRHTLSGSDILRIFWGIVFGIFILTIAILPRISERIATVTSGGAFLDNLYNPLEQYPTSVAKYLQLIVFPVDLTLYHTMYVFPIWLNWVIITLYLACVIYFYKNNKLLSFALVFIFLISISSMTPIKVAWLVAERYIYFGSLGLCLVLGLVFEFLYRRKYVKYLATIVFGIIFGLNVIRTYLRNDNWNTNHKLWVNTCQVSPNSHNAWNNIGDDYDKLKDYPNAIKGFTQSTVVKPDYADAFHNRANIFFKMGRLDLARDSYTTALRFNPNLYQSYMSLVQVAMSDKKPQEAFIYANELLKRDPNNYLVHFMFGQLYKSIGRKDEAQKAFVRALQLNPGFEQAKAEIGQL